MGCTFISRIVSSEFLIETSPVRSLNCYCHLNRRQKVDLTEVRITTQLLSFKLISVIIIIYTENLLMNERISVISKLSSHSFYRELTGGYNHHRFKFWPSRPIWFYTISPVVFLIFSIPWTYLLWWTGTNLLEEQHWYPSPNIHSATSPENVKT